MTKKIPLKRRGVVLLAVALGCLPAAAQDFNTVAPQQPPPQGPGAIVTPPVPAVPAPAADKRLLDNLNGLRFVDSVQKIMRGGVGGSGIRIESLPLMDSAKLRDQLSPFIGKPLMASDLPRISKIVIDWYRANNHPVVDVAFPEQDINSGVVQAVVTDYRLGKVTVAGNNWFSSGVISGEMQTAPGSTIDFNTLKEDLNRLNHNPFRTVNAIFAKSDEIGATDITLQTQDRLPLRVYASYDNTGLPITGRDRYSIGFNYGDLFGLDQQISYQFITSPDLWKHRFYMAGQSGDPRFNAHSINYYAPLPNGDAINVFGFYVEQVPIWDRISARSDTVFRPAYGIKNDAAGRQACAAVAVRLRLQAL